MAIGVDYNLFWTLTPNELQPFKKAFLISMEIQDINNWKLGNYIRFSINNVLSSGKSEYPNEPFSFGTNIKDEELLKVKGKENNELVKFELLRRSEQMKMKLSGGENINE